jgi:hypothetical protein
MTLSVFRFVGKIAENDNLDEQVLSDLLPGPEGQTVPGDNLAPTYCQTSTFSSVHQCLGMPIGTGPRSIFPNFTPGG